MKLRDPRHEITIYERSKANSTSGWGVTFGERLLAELRQQDQETADALEAAAFRWQDQVAHIRGEQVIAPGGDAYNISRRRLIDVLTDRATALGVRIEYGMEVRDPAELPEADLIVAADGVNSQVRAAVGGFNSTVVTGQNKYIWLGSDKVFDAFNFLFTQTPQGWVWAHAYGIDAESSTFIVECSAPTWARLGFDTMPASDALAVLEELFRKHLGEHRLIGRLGDGSTAKWLNFKTISNERWHSGKVVLLGDSAHTAHFAIGMGTTLAVEDAICLADLLHQHLGLEPALIAYQRQRKAELIPTLAEARCSARWLENLDTYVRLKPQVFGVLLYARRSPLIALLPPRISFWLRQGATKVKFLDTVRDVIAPAAKSVYSRQLTRRGAPRTEQRSHDTVQTLEEKSTPS
jgi:2-polyprenyl-6-methoxyphenol hydroxylase-like FAD-dependent oxidoreductase